MQRSERIQHSNSECRGGNKVRATVCVSVQRKQSRRNVAAVEVVEVVECVLQLPREQFRGS